MKKWTMAKWLLRLEGTAVLAAAMILYNRLGFSWGLFALLLLTPDLAALGYLLNNRTGSRIYNLFHSYTVPLLGALVAFLLPLPAAQPLALIWLAHIGMDRMVGYGLKYPQAFQDTHLGRV